MINVWVSIGLCLCFCCLFYYLGWLRGSTQMALVAYTKGASDTIQMVKREINKLIEEENDGE
jgi:hypothetical protein